MSIHAVDKKKNFFKVGRQAKIDLFSCYLRGLDKVKKSRHFDD